MVKVPAEDIKLVMWKKLEMPERNYNQETKAWEKTGKTTERTEYTFRDEFGDVLVLIGSNEYRELEGRQCDVTVGIRYNEFSRKNTLSLESCNPAD